MIRMLGCLQPRTASYLKGELMTQAGDPIHEIGVVLSGSVAVTKETPLGERIVLSKIPSGGIYGEVIALSGEPSSRATIFAAEACTVLYILPHKILNPCRNVCPWHSTLTENLVHVVADKALFLNRKIDFLVIKSMRGKLCTFLYEYYKKTGNTTFTLPYNRNELADFLNVSRPSMSRELGRMRDEGILTFSGNTFHLVNLTVLINYVE
ncbi:MAG: Crp/Fnr family transcriptional regulator [Ruminococcaceae bacterium]|nr:Crp/Fnr family transcriptional regulator [Oscillospiraceae bacterium]HHV33006.1 Crp/Fnr family transcriptional regulator [Clostridiales bacterium]